MRTCPLAWMIRWSDRTMPTCTMSPWQTPPAQAVAHLDKSRTVDSEERPPAPQIGRPEKSPGYADDLALGLFPRNGMPLERVGLVSQHESPVFEPRQTRSDEDREGLLGALAHRYALRAVNGFFLGQGGVLFGRDLEVLLVAHPTFIAVVVKPVVISDASEGSRRTGTTEREQMAYLICFSV